MTSSAQEFKIENKLNSNEIEFSKLILRLNQKIIQEKFEKYSLDFTELSGMNITVKIHVVQKEESTSAVSSNESAYEKEIPLKVENIYRTKLLKEFKKRKTFLKEV